MDKIEKCCNPHCIKDHCAHHRSGFKDVEAEEWDMNPENAFKCECYLAKFKVKMKYNRR